jgi:monosaccharide-transporting ATPase
VLIVDEPTRGIDIGAKSEILKLLRSLADEGLSVLMISSELEELLAAADRVTVLSDGTSVATLPRKDLSEAALLSAMAHQAGPSKVIWHDDDRNPCPATIRHALVR